MRYGLSGGIVIAGCAGGVLPMPVIALRRNF